MRPLAWLLFLAGVWPFEAIAGLAPTSSLPWAYHGHALVAYSGFLYNIGGLGSQGVSGAPKVLYAPIGASGEVGVWKEGVALPEGVFFHAAVASSGTLYVLGGRHFAGKPTISRVVYYSRLNADASPGPWQATTPLPEAVFFPSAAVHEGTVYVTGGWNGLALSRGVYSADIQADASLGPWVSRAPLPEAIYTHAAVSNGTLYVLGGVIQDGSLIHNTVYHSRINPDKSLAGWALTTPLPQPLSNHAAAVAAGRIYVTGGWNGAQTSAEVIAAAVKPDQGLGAWASLGSLPTGLYLHAQAATDRFLYISGGHDRQAPQKAVYFMPLLAPPPPKPADALPPRTSLAIGPPKHGEAPTFISGASPLSLSAVDDFSVLGDGAGSGVGRTWWSLGSADFILYQGNFTIPAEGAHWLRYYSSDLEDNREEPRLSALAVDLTPPLAMLGVGSPSAKVFNQELITPETPLMIEAQDPVSAGVASGLGRVWHALAGGAQSDYSGPFYLGIGIHEMRFGAMDHVGHAAEGKASLAAATFLMDAVAGVESLELSGRAGVAGRARTNGAFKARGEALVQGDVWALSADLRGQSRVSGTLHKGQATLAPEVLDLRAARRQALAHNDNARIPPRFLAGGRLVLKSREQLSLPAGEYYLAGLELGGRSSLSVSGPVALFLDGPMTLKGDSQLNATGEAARLWILGAYEETSAARGRGSSEDEVEEDDEDEDDEEEAPRPGHGISLRGRVRAACLLYAPRSSVSLSARSQFAGRLLGRAVVFSGRALHSSTLALSLPQRRLGTAEVLAGKPPEQAPKQALSGAGGARAWATSHAPAQARFDAPLVGANSMPAFELSAEAAFALVTAQGSAVRTQDRSGVLIPEGAVSALGVTVAQEQAQDPLEGRRRRGDMERRALKAAGPAVEFGPEGAAFNKPVTLELPYDPSLLPAGVPEASLAVHYWSQAKGEWEALPSMVDSRGRVVRAQTSHFSVYQALSPAAPGEAPPEEFGLREVYAFPNPARGGENPTLHVEAGSADAIEIRIYDVSGELKYSASLSGPRAAFEQPWSVAGVASGVYTYVVTAMKQGRASLRKIGQFAVIK